ncbi:MAG: peptide chain release factor N(5)-glutamine methyltransferase [Christensenellaceae bacterium]|nr:peptide chain release factor N(5)-glutamine methyltransferase [Christensenellaceae bacterium]
MNFRTLRDKGTEKLSQAGVPNASHDAGKLLAWLIGTSPLYASSINADIPEDIIPKYFSLIERRANREPLQYILGEAEFMGLNIEVEPCVLIPRFDSECLVESCLDLLEKNDTVLDLCTGSGAIAIAIKKHRPDAIVYASDISQEALNIAKKNAKLNDLDICFIKSDMFCDITLNFDIIVCNPPYIPENDMLNLQPEVKREPALALSAGKDGMDIYRRLFPDGRDKLKPGGFLICEMGDEQKETITDIAKDSGYTFISERKDTSGLTRALIFTI